MDSFEFNKIAAAILTTALVFIGIKEIGNVIYHVDKPEKSAYKIEGVEQTTTGQVAEKKLKHHLPRLHLFWHQHQLRREQKYLKNVPLVIALIKVERIKLVLVFGV